MNGNKGGRPQKQIDWDLVDKFLQAGCSANQIAAAFNIHHDTFYARVKEKYGMGYTEFASSMIQYGEALLKLAQFRKAIDGSSKGNVEMLKWLGKNRLGQKESPTESSISESAIKNFEILMNQIEQLQNFRKMEEISKSAEQRS